MNTITVLVPRQVQVESCPFCAMDTTDIGGGSGNPFFVKCNTCFASGPRQQLAEDAIANWNAAVQSKQKAIYAAVQASQTAGVLPASLVAAAGV